MCCPLIGPRAATRSNFSGKQSHLEYAYFDKKYLAGRHSVTLEEMLIFSLFIIANIKALILISPVNITFKQLFHELRHARWFIADFLVLTCYTHEMEDFRKSNDMSLCCIFA